MPACRTGVGVALLLASVSCAAAPSAAAGRDVYTQNGCATCHGATGAGDGPVGKTLDPRPRDFRDAAAFKNGIDVSAIADTIAAGIPDGGKMPQFSHLTTKERRSLALYVISLRDPHQERRIQP